ncbi:hypothetical protein Tco_0609928 [Tanacetum coccineum]
MPAAAMKHMASNFAKLDKFEGVDFRRWQKKMHFLLSSMSVVFVLTSPVPEDSENATVEQIMKKVKWYNDEYVCRGLILNGMSDPLFDIYQNVESSKEYMAEDASRKKFLVSNFTKDQLWNNTMNFLIYLDSDKPKGNNVAGLSVVNTVKHNNSTKYNDNKGVNTNNV